MVRITILIFVLIVNVCSGEEGPLVKTPLGLIRGHYKKSYNGRTVATFEGLPYAKPPVGNLRFRNPQNIESWKGIWEASTVHDCMQNPFMGEGGPTGEEDCLYLNIYVPREEPNADEKLDVIVSIHGGAFMVGSGHNFTDPKYLMDRDIILVSLNYRLGVLGFLSTEDDSASGNFGLKDQTQALKWIQQNIAAFGGNPDSVTLVGVSAGGASVHFHYLSPLSKGLFHRGISASGTSLNAWALQNNPLEKAKTIASAVGCDFKDTKEMISCLQQRSAREIVKSAMLLYAFGFFPIAPFGPVVERNKESPFLNNHPYLLLKTGKINDIPWINSVTSAEGLFPAALFSSNLDDVDTQWDALIPHILNYNYTISNVEKLATSQEIKKYYLGDNKLSLENFDDFVRLCSDRLFVLAAEESTRIQAKISKSPVYFYVFDYHGENKNSIVKLFDKTGKISGVSHGDDSLYFLSSMFGAVKFSKDDEKIKELLLNIYTTFAKNGKPQLNGIDWTPVSTSKEMAFLKIISPVDVKLQKTTDLASKEFWNSLPLRENRNIVLIKDEL